MNTPKIAVLGGGIAGMYAAYQLDKLGYQISLFEQAERLGGHTDTHYLHSDVGDLAVDTGFIVFNRRHYPLFTALLDELNIPTQLSNMSFSVHHELSGKRQYAAGRKGGLFCQRRNSLSIFFWRMLWDIVRFYGAARRLPDNLDPEISLGEYLTQMGYSQTYREWHILPMAAALWSCSLDQAAKIPLLFLVEFMQAHDMLQVSNRPQWETIQGGSQTYVEALQRAWSVQAHVNASVSDVQRFSDRVELTLDNQPLLFDGVIMACHSDQALSLISDVSGSEQAVLGAIAYKNNDMLLHTDRSLLPSNRRAWASWNTRIPADNEQRCTVSYWMNLLQGLPDDQTYITSLNQSQWVDPDKIILQRQYAHPIFNQAARAAVRRWQDINGQQRTWFCGAYWGWGFHEDGARSAQRVVDAIDQQYKHQSAA